MVGIYGAFGFKPKPDIFGVITAIGVLITFTALAFLVAAVIR